MTEYLKFKGKAKFAQVYTPDEFRGAVRWKMRFYPESEAELKRMTSVLNSSKKIKEDEDGKYLDLYRPTTKFIKGKVVNFTPPIIYDEEGDMIVSYVSENTGKLVRSFDEGTDKTKRVGEPVLIGNGSEVEITLSVYQTQMGPGNRLESIKLIDLIEYVPPEPEVKEEQKETKVKKEKPQETEGDEKAPWD